MKKNPSRNDYYEELESRIQSLGGQFNAHLHLDRAGTYKDQYFPITDFNLDSNNHISLHKKHALIARIHEGPAYDSSDLEARVRKTLDTMANIGTRGADTMVDVTPDRVGTSALELISSLKTDYSSKLQLRTASYTPLGFNDAEPQRWEIYEEGASKADFLGALPEADDKIDYPNNIGFEEHCERVLELARKNKQMVHFHTDQRNEPRENGTERVLSVIRNANIQKQQDEEPQFWVVHMVSPSTYSEERFQTLTKELVDLNVGVICCPSAAVGMRQLRNIPTPTYNSIPRVLELLASGVKVRLASDNIADICSPTTTADLVDEIFILSAALRFYNIDILAHLAAGIDLNTQQRSFIQNHLIENEQEINKVIERYHV